MRKLIFIFFVSFLTGNLFAQSAKIAADKAYFYFYGGNNSDEARSIKELPGGGYILAGTTSSFGQGNTSVYLVKTDSMGKHVWSNVYGGTENDLGYSVEVTADSGYFVSGYSNSFNPPNGYDAYYFRTDKNGNLLWQKTVSGSDWDFIYGSAPMPDGGFILCGETYTHSNGGSDAYLIRINKIGDTLWTKHYGGLFNETFNKVSILNDQIYAVGKNTTHATDTVADGWLVKLDTNGTILKDIFLSGPKHFEEIIEGITPYTNTTFHICGRTNLLDSNSVIPILFKVDTALNLTWLPLYPATSSPNILAFTHVINISYGSICAMGSHNGGYGGLSLFLMGFDATGTYIQTNNGYNHDGGGDKDEFGYDGIWTKSGRVIAVGSSLSDQYFCPTSNLGDKDVYLERFESDSIYNSLISPTNVVTCFLDTLFLWASSTHYYSDNFKVKLFPNPVNNETQLEITSNRSKTYTAKIFSVLGNEVLNFKVYSNNINTLDLSGLSEGSYFLKLQDESGQNLSVMKFIVTK